MDSVLWYVLPLAAAVALSILPVLAAVLLLLSTRPVKAGTAYALGWSLGLLVLVVVFAAGARLIPMTLSDDMPTWVHYIEIVVGALLTVGGTVSVLRGRRRASSPGTPPWMARASDLSAGRAFVFGLLMNVRPKNLTLTFAAGLAIGAAPVPLLAGGVVVVVFTVVGVSTVAGLVLAYAIGPGRLRPILTFLNTWLVSNAAMVLRISLVVIGIFLIAVGITALVTGS